MMVALSIFYYFCYVESNNTVMKNLLLALSFFALTAACSCEKIIPSGIETTQEFEIDGSYDELLVSNAFDICVSDQVSKITITADEVIMPKIEVKHVNSRLTIGIKSVVLSYLAESKVILPYNSELAKIDLSGACTMTSEYPIRSSLVKVRLTGASNLLADIEATDVEMNLTGASTYKGALTASNSYRLVETGASNATLWGSTDKLKLNLTGASNIVKQVDGERYAFSCRECDGALTGASNAFIHSDGSIVVKLTGASDLHYTGNASTSGSSTTGASNLIHDVL